MKLSSWMAVKAVVVAIFGIGFVLIAPITLTLYALDASPSTRLMAQLFGTAFIFEAVVLWRCRNIDLDDVAGQAIVTAVVASNAIGFLVCLVASLSGVWNAMGWLSVALYLAFGLGFGYFLFTKPAPKTAPRKAARKR
ncbi:MAG TPA: hypothetical protein VLL49_02250 [Anaerolineales bacterium]|nr:hypothetical protein [Anaerolineales bacterium]